MSTDSVCVSADELSPNVVVQLRETYKVLNDLVPERLIRHGFDDFRPAHSTVFEHLDDHGSTVSALADRAAMTKQAMAELVTHLEQRGYLVREPDPSDRRAKLVLPTERGRAVYAVARSLVPELHSRIEELLGKERWEQLREDLELIRHAFGRTDRNLLAPHGATLSGGGTPDPSPDDLPSA